MDKYITTVFCILFPLSILCADDYDCFCQNNPWDTTYCVPCEETEEGCDDTEDPSDQMSPILVED